MSNQSTKKRTLEFYGGKYMSLLPLGLFVIACILLFVVIKDYSMESVCAGGFIAIIAGSLLAKKSSGYWNAVLKGMTMETIQTLALILIVVGMFGRMMTRAGIANGFVWIGLKLHLTGSMFTVFTFMAACLLALSTGSSFGTLFTAFPILYPSGILLGANPAALAGAILSGAIFGDNIAPISDTTIASASSQAYKYKAGVADIGGAVSSRIKYGLAAAAASVICFAVTGGGGAVDTAGNELLAQHTDPRSLIMLIPVVILLIVAIKSRNIFLASTAGIISGIAVGLVSGVLTPGDIVSVTDGAMDGFFVDGIKNVIGTIGYLYAVAGLIGLLNESGTMEDIIQKLINSKLNDSVIGSEIIMAIGVMLSCLALGAANGPSIIMFGPIANEIGKTKDLHPYRRANLLDAFAGSLPIIVPVVSCFIFIAVSSANGCMADYSFIRELSPISISLHTYHCFFLFAVFAIAIFTGWGRKYEGKNGEMLSEAQYKAQK